MKTPSWLRVVAAADEGPAIVYLYGLIGEDWWGEGNAAIDFAKALDELSPRDVELRINSEGGSVFEGYAMYSALKRYAGNVTAYVDGLAASAASYIALGADEVVMGEAAFMMIHNSWAGACYAGNAEEWTEFAAEISSRLKMLDEQIVAIYDAHSDKTADELRAAMAETTWLTANDAVEWGFAARVEEGLKAAACITKVAAEHFGIDKIPATVEIVAEEPEPPVSDAATTIAGEPTDAASPSDGQEPEAEASQEARVRSVAFIGGVRKQTIKPKE